MHVSKLSHKGQVTIPKKIREVVGLEPGDLVVYELQDQVVILKRVAPFDVAFHAALSQTLEEWTTPEDDEAFSDL